MFDSVGFPFNLKAPKGLPTVYYFGRYGDFAVLVMEKVGASLKQLLKATTKLSLATFARIGKQAVNLVKLILNGIFVFLLHFLFLD